MTPLAVRWLKFNLVGAVGTLHMHHYVAGALAIALCSVLNFAASEWFVFRK